MDRISLPIGDQHGRLCYLYVGPTLTGLARQAIRLPPDVRSLPPIRRGDIPDLVANHAPGTIAIADGNFHQCMAVGHAEIREALQMGWRVWGLASMGAIRACEMRTLGMRGFGDVYDLFAEHPDTPDDEVALLHEPGPQYRALTEPLVHIRHAVRWMHERAYLSSDVADEIIRFFSGRWYGERTVDLLERLVRDRAPDAASATASLHDFDRFRTKSHDLIRFIDLAPWRDT